MYMKIITLIITTLFSVYVLADCTVYAPKRVICRNESGTVAIYHMSSDSLWKSKIYYPESTGEQTEAVYYRTYRSFDLKSLCLIGTEMKAFQDSIELNQDDRAAVDIDCTNKQNDFLQKIEQGTEIVIPAFELALGKMEKVSAMYCMNYHYVRTFKYNKITQLETDRQDYSNLKPGTYCQDFLTDNKIYWVPKKDQIQSYPGSLLGGS